MDRMDFGFFVCILVVSFLGSAHSNQLGSPCTKDKHCKVDNSRCSSGVCTCEPYHAQLGTTECLESKLLGRDCLVNEQCSLRVANSTCVGGHCHCSQGFIRFRKHTCLGPAKPGDVCYSDEHCRLWNKNSHCQFLIRRLFGKCVCDFEGKCQSYETVKPPFGTGSSQPPFGSGSSQPPFGSGSSQPPFGSGSSQAPFGSGSSKPPFGSGSSRPPFSSGSSQPPFSSGSSKPPFGSGSSQPPFSSGSSQPPFSSGSFRPPFSSGSSRPPGFNATFGANNDKIDATDGHGAETTTSIAESDNKGEAAGQGNENPPKIGKEPQQTNSQFVDPFQHQREHLRPTSPAPPSVEGANEKPEGESASDDIRMESAAAEATESGASEGTTATESPDAPAEGSKYRVEAGVSGPEPIDVAAVSLGYPCRSDAECRKRDDHSRCLNGVCDCVSKTNGSRVCGSGTTGCGPETFQCRESGACISWFFVCDGRDDCSDRSDEECRGPKCPETSFRCGESEICVSRAVLCDGVKNCPNGEDERFCTPDERNSTQGCPEHTFRCTNGRCLPKFEFCNAVPKCSDGSDESPLLCSAQLLARKAAKRRDSCPFECGNGRCRSTAIVCSGRDGCGDNSDEASCSVCRCPAVPKEN